MTDFSTHDGDAAALWPKPKERESKRALKREAVLRASVKLFNEKGFHATSLDEVAAVLQVTKPTIYHYFPSKDDILFECVRLGYEEIRAVAGEAEGKAKSGIGRLRLLMEDYAMLMTKDFGRCAARTTDVELSEQSRQRFRGLKRDIEMIVRAAVQAGMDDGTIRQGNVVLITFTLIGALNWIAYWHDPKGRLPPEAIAEGAVETLLRGVAV